MHVIVNNYSKFELEYLHKSNTFKYIQDVKIDYHENVESIDADFLKSFTGLQKLEEWQNETSEHFNYSLN